MFPCFVFFLFFFSPSKQAETDMLDSENRYELSNTGQGLNRVQMSTSVMRAMRQILHKVQTDVGSWVGSSVIHLGDHNVPNALMFIDKV
jgi:hypothetical protein